MRWYWCTYVRIKRIRYSLLCASCTNKFIIIDIILLLRIIIIIIIIIIIMRNKLLISYKHFEFYNSQMCD